MLRSGGDRISSRFDTIPKCHTEVLLCVHSFLCAGAETGSICGRKSIHFIPLD